MDFSGRDRCVTDEMQSEQDIVAKTRKQSSGGKWKEPAAASHQQRKGSGTGRSRPGRAHETEEEALIRRFHDAQRMARFRARKKKALEAACTAPDDPPAGRGAEAQEHTESRYSELLSVLERLGKDVRLSYAGSRSSAERLKSGIARARALVRDCLAETREHRSATDTPCDDDCTVTSRESCF